MEEQSQPREGQAVLSCQLCEISIEIQSKCLECRLLMCNTCTKQIHPKIKTAGEHTIINIKDIGNIQETPSIKLDFNSIRCQKHDEQTCCLFCKTCDELICLDCTTKFHTKHHMVKIEEEYNRKKEDLIQCQKQLEQNKQGLQFKNDTFDQILKSEQHSHDKTKYEILQHEKTIQTAVHQQFATLVQELGKSFTSIKTLITEKQSKVQNDIDETEDMVNKATNIIQLNDVSKFFKEAQVFHKPTKVQIPSLNLKYNPVLKFSEAQMTKNKVGFLEKPTGINPKNVIVKKVKEFDTNFKCVDRICLSPNTTFWISSYHDNMLQNLTIDNSTYLTYISSYNEAVHDIAVNTKWCVLMTTFKSHMQQLNTQTGILTDTKYHVHPKQTSAVHVSLNDKIIVGAYNPDRGVVIVMDKSGQHQKTYEYDNEDKPICSIPRTITSDNNSNIWVVDVVPGEQRGKVVLIAINGDILYYSGHINTTRHKFNPKDIVITSMENAVVTDFNNSGLHILNQSAMLIKYIDLNDIGIKLPCSMLYRDTRILYIGCSTMKGDTEKAKLYQIELSGC